MKAYLIDPEARTVTSVDVAEGDDFATLNSWYEHMRCTDVEAVYPISAEGDLLLVDEYGTLKPGPYHRFFCRLWPNASLTGRALWVGRDDAETVAPRCSIEYVAGHIAWVQEREDATPLAPGIFILHGKRTGASDE